MPFSLPNPSVPTNGQLGDATPILQNELAIAQAISAFDGSQINAKSVVEGALADAINSRLRGLETLANFVYSGCIWSAVSGLNGTMTGGTIYVNGYRTIITGVGSNTFASSTDTYIDIDYLGNLTYNAVANNATAPSLTANALRVAKVVTSGVAVTSVVQTGWDSLGNPILLRTPSPIELGYSEITGITNVFAASDTEVTGLATPVIVPTGRDIKIEVMGQWGANLTGYNFPLKIWDGAVGGTLVRNYSMSSASGNAAILLPANLTARISAPTPGAHTYRFSMSGDGTHTISIYADGSGFKGSMLVTVV